MRNRSPIVLSFALLFACGHVSAAAMETQHLSADGSVSCPDNSLAGNDRGELGDVDPGNAAVAPVRRTEKARTVVPTRSSGTRATAPRWHSFLPGMIR